MATSMHVQSAALTDAAEAIGQALKVAVDAGLADTYAEPLRRAMSHLFESATEAAGQQLEIQRLNRYTERLEDKNSELTARVAGLQHQSEQLVLALSPALETVVNAFNRAAQFKSTASLPLDHIRRGSVSDETLDAVREAPDMAHQGD